MAPLTVREVENLERIRNNYGCGASGCVACYPIQYRCELCGEDFDSPIANGETFLCLNCDYLNNGEENG
jgi:hypothetical protein